jgi:hypothetical protein
LNTTRLIDRKQGRQLLTRLCEEAGVPVELVQKLVELEQEYVEKERRDGLRGQMDDLFEEFTDGDANVSSAHSAA